MIDLIELVDKVTGPVEPTFDRKVHEQHYENLMEKRKLLLHIAYEVKNASEGLGGHEYLQDIAMLADDTVNEALGILMDTDDETAERVHE